MTTPHARVRLTVDLPSREDPARVHARGSEGIVVEPIAANIWLIEIRVPDASLVGDAWYESFDLHGDEFELVPPKPDAVPGPTPTVSARPQLTLLPWEPGSTPIPDLASNATRLANSA